MQTVQPSDAPFDRVQLRRQRQRAAARFSEHDFLYREVTERLAERLDEINRHFPKALLIGGGSRAVRDGLLGRGGIRWLATADPAPAMTRLSGGPSLTCDEEALPFAPGSLDLVLAPLTLSAVNDLPGTLIQIRRILKPDGLFLATVFGGATLRELRESLMTGEMAIRDGVSPRVAPTIDVRDGGALLQRAGFALPVVDSDSISVTYPDALKLMTDLRGMGLGNCLAARSRRPTPRSVLAAAAAAYAEGHANSEQRLPASFELVTLTGWAPAQNQQQPLRPGSAKARLAEALGGRETGLGEKPGEN